MLKSWKSVSLAGRFCLLGLFLASLLVACGDSNTPTPASSATNPTASSATTSAATTNAASSVTTSAATTAASGNQAGTTAAATTVSSLTTTAPATTASASSTTGAATSVAAALANASQPAVGPCLDAGAPPAPTPTAVNTNNKPADVPELFYNGARTLSASASTSQNVLGNLSGPNFSDLLGQFTADKLNFYATEDGLDKVQAYYTKLLQDKGWQLVSTNGSAAQKEFLLIFSSGSKKILLSLQTVDDTTQYPPEFKEFLKTGNTLILAASGGTVLPTPFDIPGTPVAPLQAGQHIYATIEMEKGGTIKMELCPNLAPRTVENFIKLTTKGFYNGLTFHRVEKSPQPFVVQGGDPKGDGTGGPGYTIPDEFTTQKKHTRGTVAMAHSSAPNSAGSQFYICLADASFLDGKYAIFGQVTEGMDVVDKIAVGDKMKTVTISVTK